MVKYTLRQSGEVMTNIHLIVPVEESLVKSLAIAKGWTENKALDYIRRKYNQVASMEIDFRSFAVNHETGDIEFRHIDDINGDWDYLKKVFPVD